MQIQTGIEKDLNTPINHRGGGSVPFDRRPRRAISIVCVTTCLEVGGAEMMLYKLLSGMDRTRFLPQVISLRDLGALSDKSNR